MALVRIIYLPMLILSSAMSTLKLFYRVMRKTGTPMAVRLLKLTIQINQFLVKSRVHRLFKPQEKMPIVVKLKALPVSHMVSFIWPGK
jgi:hypothetical protein